MKNSLRIQADILSAMECLCSKSTFSKLDFFDAYLSLVKESIDEHCFCEDHINLNDFFILKTEECLVEMKKTHQKAVCFFKGFKDKSSKEKSK